MGNRPARLPLAPRLGATMTPATTYQRILLKLSGEMLEGEQGYGIDANVLQYIADELVPCSALGVQIAIVIGGGNIMRGKPPRRRAWIVRRRTTWACWPPSSTRSLCKTPSKTPASDARTDRDRDAVVAEPFIRRRAIRHLREGPRCHPRRGHRQSVLHDGYGRRPARRRAACRRADEGHEGGRRLRRRPGSQPERTALP